MGSELVFYTTRVYSSVPTNQEPGKGYYESQLQNANYNWTNRNRSFYDIDLRNGMALNTLKSRKLKVTMATTTKENVAKMHV